MAVSEGVHELHHITIAENVEKIRTAMDQRRAAGYAASVLRSHLGSAHGVRMLSGPPKSLAQLHEMHVGFHHEDGHFPGCHADREAVGGHTRACVVASNKGRPG